MRYTLIVLLVSFCSASWAESLADRRSDTSTTVDVNMVIEEIHMKHGPTAAGPGMPHSDMMSHTSDMAMDDMHGEIKKHTTYRSLRSRDEYRDLTAHEYRRKVFGSN